MEQWKKIEGFENYSVSTHGRVRNDKRNTIMVLRPCNVGYLRIRLCNNGVNKKFLVHRLVAQAFISNPNKLPCVNHIDEDKTNNRIENLEWCTYKYNNNHGTRNNRISTKLKKITKGRPSPNRIRVIVDDVEYMSICSAHLDAGIPSRILGAKRTEYKGHKIKYITNEDNNKKFMGFINMEGV